MFNPDIQFYQSPKVVNTQPEGAESEGKRIKPFRSVSDVYNFPIEPVERKETISAIGKILKRSYTFCSSELEKRNDTQFEFCSQLTHRRKNKDANIVNVLSRHSSSNSVTSRILTDSSLRASDISRSFAVVIMGSEENDYHADNAGNVNPLSRKEASLDSPVFFNKVDVSIADRIKKQRFPDLQTVLKCFFRNIFSVAAPTAVRDLYIRFMSEEKSISVEYVAMSCYVLSLSFQLVLSIIDLKNAKPKDLIFSRWVLITAGMATLYLYMNSIKVLSENSIVNGDDIIELAEIKKWAELFSGILYSSGREIIQSFIKFKYNYDIGFYWKNGIISSLFYFVIQLAGNFSMSYCKEKSASLWVSITCTAIINCLCETVDQLVYTNFKSKKGCPLKPKLSLVAPQQLSKKEIKSSGDIFTARVILIGLATMCQGLFGNTIIPVFSLTISFFYSFFIRICDKKDPENTEVTHGT